MANRGTFQLSHSNDVILELARTFTRLCHDPASTAQALRQLREQTDCMRLGRGGYGALTWL